MLQMITDSIGKQLSYTWILMTTNRIYQAHTNVHTQTERCMRRNLFTLLRGPTARSYSLDEKWSLLIRHTQNIDEHLGCRIWFFTIFFGFVASNICNFCDSFFSLCVHLLLGYFQLWYWCNDSFEAAHSNSLYHDAQIRVVFFTFLSFVFCMYFKRI